MTLLVSVDHYNWHKQCSCHKEG